MEKQVRRTREERFRVVAPARTRRAITAIRSVKRCTSKNGYQWTSAEGEAVVSALEKEVVALREAFFPPEKSEPRFELPTPRERVNASFSLGMAAPDPETAKDDAAHLSLEDIDPSGTPVPELSR